jgi:Xaa-Pro aminopeptidase
MERLAKFRQMMKEKKLDAMLLATFETRVNKNIQYLSGFTGEDGYLFITQDNAKLFVDGRFPEQARGEAGKGIEVELVEFPVIDFLFKKIGDNCTTILGIEESVLSVAFHKKLAEKLPNVALKCADGMAEEMRIIKTPEESEILKMSCKIACEAYEETLKHVKAGVKESDLCAELEYQMKRRGAKKSSFDIIIASGYRGAMAHGVASDKKLEMGEFVVFDWGCFYRGYASDCTRTIVMGEPTKRHLEIYNLVRQAQEAAMGYFKPGVKTADADKAARDIINNAGYEKNFNHSLGHGVGLEVHENPRASNRVEDVFKVGMVCTNEPGIYFEGWGGVRIEDTVLITEQGGLPLTPTSKDLVIIE